MHLMAIFLSFVGPPIVRVQVVRSIEEGERMGAFFTGTASNFAVYRGTHGGVPSGALEALGVCLAECEGKWVTFSVERSFERLGKGRKHGGE